MVVYSYCAVYNVQLFMDIKQGVAISPVYIMACIRCYTAAKEYTVTGISVNGKILQTKDFSPYKWDKITLPVDLFNRPAGMNSHVWNSEVNGYYILLIQPKIYKPLLPVNSLMHGTKCI